MVANTTTPEPTAEFFTDPTEEPPQHAVTALSLPDDVPQEVREHPLLDEAAWIAFRDSGIEPLEASEMVTTLESRAGFLIGAWLLDKSVRGGGLLANVKPQMLREVDVLTAGRFKNAIIVPRRSAKTTTLWCVLLGRCWLEEVHMAGYTMCTTQKKAAERYRIDVYAPIARKWPDEKTRPVKLYKGNGTERVEFTNGSLLAILSPEGDAFRSGAYDTLVADEGGAASVELGEDITSAVLPAFDTRPNGQFITAGTAAKFREGNLLWDLLNDPKAGRLRFTVPDTIDPEELEAWEPDEEHPRARVRDIILGMHPGVDSGLTTIEKIEDNYRSFKPDQFREEYLGIFGAEGTTSAIIPAPKWEAGAIDADLPPVPAYFRWALAVHPDGDWASLGCAWWGPDGVAEVGLLHHQGGTTGLASKLLIQTKKHAVPLTWDSGSQSAAVEVEELNRAKSRPELDPATTSDVRRAASKFVKMLDEGTLRHYRQAQLDGAVEIAVKRSIGNAGGWGFGRPKGEWSADITALEAVALALHRLGDPPKPSKVEIFWDRTPASG